MTMLSQNFSREEMTASEAAERLGLNNVPSPEIILNLTKTAMAMEKVRTLLGHSIHINSGYRSPALNAAIGGASSSAHCLGYAVDFICPQFGTPYEVARAIEASTIDYDQCIYEMGVWTHLSFAPSLRGEVLTKKSGAAPYQRGLVR